MSSLPDGFCLCLIMAPIALLAVSVPTCGATKSDCLSYRCWIIARRKLVGEGADSLLEDGPSPKGPLLKGGLIWALMIFHERV